MSIPPVTSPHEKKKKGETEKKKKPSGEGREKKKGEKGQESDCVEDCIPLVDVFIPAIATLGREKKETGGGEGKEKKLSMSLDTSQVSRGKREKGRMGPEKEGKRREKGRRVPPLGAALFSEIGTLPGVVEKREGKGGNEGERRGGSFPKPFINYVQFKEGRKEKKVRERKETPRCVRT